MQMAEIYAVSNQKGGVAKTTNSINVTGAAAAQSQDVLAIDSDPQGYLTNNLGLGEAYRADGDSVVDMWKDPTEYDPADLIVSHEEFDVLPAHIDMFWLEQELTAAGWKVRERLSMIVDRLPDYDLVIIDAPPSLGPINDNVLLAAENIIIPMAAAEESVLALDHLLTQVNTLERRFGTSINERAVIISDVEYPLDNEQKDIIEWIGDTFDSRCPVYEIRDRAAIKRAIKNSCSITAYNEECDQEPVYHEIVDGLVSGVGK